MDVLLRGIQESDSHQIIEWRMRPDITKFMNTNPKLTMEGQRKCLYTTNKNDNVVYWLILVDDELAGVFNVSGQKNENRTIELGYYIGEKRLRILELAVSMEMTSDRWRKLRNQNQYKKINFGI